MTVIAWAIEGICHVMLRPFDHEDNNRGDTSQYGREKRYQADIVADDIASWRASTLGTSLDIGV